MKNTNFVNATGLPNPQHYSTAQDLALLASAIIRDFPEHHPLYALKEYRYNNITQRNRNRLLWLDPNVDGVKTGHTENAGYCLIASAKRGQRRLLSVVLGTSSDSVRAQEAQKLLNVGFQQWDTVRLYEKSKPVGQLEIWKGAWRIFRDHPLERRFRDIHVITQHMMVAPPSYEVTGRVVLGLPTDPSML